MIVAVVFLPVFDVYVEAEGMRPEMESLDMLETNSPKCPKARVLLERCLHPAAAMEGPPSFLGALSQRLVTLMGPGISCMFPWQRHAVVKQTLQARCHPHTLVSKV